MSATIFSPSWYRVAELKPRLRTHIELHRHDYRGLIWYLLEDKSNGRNHRFSCSAYQLIGLLDGHQSVNQIWEILNAELGDYAPTQDEVIQLLGKLHTSDLLQCAVTPDTEELFSRSEQQKSAKIKQMFGNPMSQKFPLWDPDEFLHRMLPRIRWMFHWSVAAVLVLVIALAGLTAASHWEELTSYFQVRSLSPYNFALICLVYPVVKLLHELGHAFTTKIEDGEIHEMGIMLLVFMPIPYVNVSSSAVFRSKYKRMLVGAAGIIVELFLAALGFFLWISVETGIVRDISFNVMLIGGISSVFFNGNPLLRYDGYYILADAIEIPNLYQRSLQYLGYCCQRYLFGAKHIASPENAPGEAKWFIFYSISSFIYRMGILWVIILLVTDKLFVVGVLLAIWMVSMQIVKPILKGISFLFTSPTIERQRLRAVSTSLSVLVTVLLMIFLVPFPSSTQAQGVIWLADDAHVRAEADGFITQLLAEPYSEVKKQAPLVQIEDPLRHAQVKILEAKLNGLQTQYHANRVNDLVQAEIVKEQIISVKADLLRARERQKATVIYSPKAGNLMIQTPEDLPGKFVRQGETIGYIIDGSIPRARVLITQVDIGQVRQRIVGVEARISSDLDRSYPASILREVPGASKQLPSAALATSGGGLLTVDGKDPEGMTTIENFFQFDIEFSERPAKALMGSRVYVRFEHEPESLGLQWYRSLRQLFLKHFNV